MTIYEPLVAEGYEWVNAVHDEDYEVFLSFDGRPALASWKPVLVRRVPSDSGRRFAASDFPWLGSHALVMRKSAVDALRDILEASGELLPLSTTDGIDLFVLNAHTIDALDESNSAITRFPDSNRIMRIKKIAFVSSAINDADVFRLPHRASSTYVSQRFVDRVKTAGLRGLEFNCVWSG